MHETQVQSLGGDDPLEKEMATHSSILAWRTPWTEEPDGYSPWGYKELDTIEQLSTHTHAHTHTHTHTHTHKQRNGNSKKESKRDVRDQKH